MNLNGIRIFTDSEFRNQFIHDYDFWLIITGFSYFIIISFFTNLVIRRFRIFLTIAICLSIFGNILGLLILNTSSAIGALNSPLFILLTYRLLYEWYIKVKHRPPRHMLEVVYSREKELFYDRLLFIAFFLVSGISTAITTLMYGVIIKI